MKVKSKGGEVELPDLVDIKPSALGVVRVKMGDGVIKEFRGNRAERRRFIRRNKLVRG